MAKTKSVSRSTGAKKKRRSRGNTEFRKRPESSTADMKGPETPEQLLLKASELFSQLQIDAALPIALKALAGFREVYPNDPQASCPTLLLLGQVYLASGEVDLSREYYLKATEIDPEGRTTDAAPFLWCAQLSEEGGDDSIYWFEKACVVLRRELKALEEKYGNGEAEEEIIKTRLQLGEALCSMTEVYMTDLSFDSEAGSKCDALMTEAVLISPESPAVLQTLASVRISEVRIDDARSALIRSMELWKHLPPDDVNIPDFATRISLTRLLMEVEMEAEAIDVVDQLVQEDDQSVEALYLGAWSRYLLFEKGVDTANESRDWFRRCLRLYTSLAYEDEKMRQHVVEMTTKLDEILGPPVKDEDDEEWEDEEAVEEEGEIETEDVQGDVSMSYVDANGVVS